MTEARRVLLIAPIFHGYSEAIAVEFRKRGHEVHLIHYDDHGSLGGRILYKLSHELPQRLTGIQPQPRFDAKVSLQAITILSEVNPEVVLVIKGDCLLPDFWEAAIANGSLTHLWLYDELRRMRHTNEVLQIVDRIATYSRQDAQELGRRGLEPVHVPNGFDASIRVSEPTPGNEILFVGARYPNREALLTGLSRRGLPVLAVGRDWSTHPIDRVRTWQWRRPRVTNKRDVSRTEAYRLMAGAAGNINSHYNQDGFTMRTFEIPGVGGLQFIDRSDICDYYEPNVEILVYSSEDELVDFCRRAIADPQWGASIASRAQARTLAEHTLAHRVAMVEAQWG